MASAVLSSNNEQHWGIRNYTVNNAVINRSRYNPNLNPNSSPNVQISKIENPSPNPNPLHMWQNKETPPPEDVIIQKDYVTIKLADYSKVELRELERRLRAEMDQVRQLRARLENINFDSSKNITGRKRGRVASFNSPELDAIVKKIMTRCSMILGKLMKHKHAWIFNTPVDTVGLGLHDYFQIIEHPMDLGTVKAKLSKKEYKTPIAFASDVRLTFKNAMTYNPKGQDAHIMADNLFGVFNKMFNPLFAKFEAEKGRVVAALGINKRVLETNNVVQNVPRSLPEPVPVREIQKVMPKLLKPKVKELRKPMMSYEEKSKLGMSLQELPSENMGAMLAILRKKDAGIAQEGDEIELDFETLDNETLWELQRFVSNLKKVEDFAVPAQVERFLVREPTPEVRPDKSTKMDIVEEDVDIGEDIPLSNYPPVQIEKDTSSGSSSDSSSSSGSGSVTSSGSDSDEDSVQSPFVDSK